jgi:hypothetical protein
VELHLLRHPSLSETGVGFPERGSDIVEKVYYEENSERVWINKEQYLEDRKGRKLSLEEMGHYMKVAKAIKLTREVQGEVEKTMG